MPGPESDSCLERAALEHADVLDVIDRIYAASLDRFAWPDALAGIADSIQASTGVLLAPPRNAQGWQIVAASGLSDELVDAYNSHWSHAAPFPEAENEASAEGAIVRPIRAPAVASPFGRFFCEPAGFQTGLMATNPASSGALLFWRTSSEPFRSVDVSRFRTLWLHVARALAIHNASWRGTEVIPTGWAASLIDLWHVAVIGFSASGNHIYANRAARRLASQNDGLSLAVDGPVASSVAQTRLLRRSIRQLADGVRDGPEWMRLTRPSGAASYEVALIRWVASSPEEPAVTMLVAALDGPIVCDRRALGRLHGLTALEARIAESLMAAMPIADIARALELSLQTTRWYVQQVREKVDATSQGHLIRRLLRSLSVIERSEVPMKSNNPAH